MSALMGVSNFKTMWVGWPGGSHAILNMCMQSVVHAMLYAGNVSRTDFVPGALAATTTMWVARWVTCQCKCTHAFSNSQTPRLRCANVFQHLQYHVV